MGKIPFLNALVVLVGGLMATTASSNTFVNFEVPQLHPMDMNLDGTRLVVCNTSANRLDIYSLESGTPVQIGSVGVGLDPVSVRFHTETEAWVVNHISDSISIVDINTEQVVETINTQDEPFDIVFAIGRAFVSCGSVDMVQVFAPIGRDHLKDIPIDGEEPRALAVSPDQRTVYVAIFESGNNTTVINGSRDLDEPNTVSHPSGPHGGQNPPPNSGAEFEPPMLIPNPPLTSLILKKNGAGQWMDDNSGDWTSMVSGADAALSNRVPGWDMLDNDVAVIDVLDMEVTGHITGLMNICMNIATNPATGSITVVGTDATNHIRFEPQLTGTFLRVNISSTPEDNFSSSNIIDLNNHLNYTTSSVAQSERNKSVGDPRGIAWNSKGSTGYVSGMGSNNVVVVNTAGARAEALPIEVGEGPTGLVLDEARERLYVLNRFSGTISVINTESNAVVNTVSFFDPTPDSIKIGRKHLYDTHKNSGLGQISCASCHVDARMDRLAWDLGAPDAESGPVGPETHNLGGGMPILTAGFEDHHSMKGPMTTQTFQDIIGKEPFHWRGDRAGLEDFNPAFIGLQGDDQDLTDAEMQEFKDFVATIHFPPNPFRNFDNSLSTSVELKHQFANGRFTLPRGAPMPNGNAQTGMRLFTGLEVSNIDSNFFNCITCHTLPVGTGTDTRFTGTDFEPIPLDEKGNNHVALVSVDGSDNKSIKVPHLRNAFDKVGMSLANPPSRAGFGFFHDGTVDSLTSFFSSLLFVPRSDQDIADIVALMMSFSGSDFGDPDTNPSLGLPESPSSIVQSQDAHAAVGRQLTIDTPFPTAPIVAIINAFIGVADSGKVDLIVQGTQDGERRTWKLIAGSTRGVSSVFMSDRLGETVTADGLVQLAQVDTPLTYSVVPLGSGIRLALDWDEDGVFNRDEIDAGNDPLNGEDAPSLCSTFDLIETKYAALVKTYSLDADFDGDGVSELGALALVKASACDTDDESLGLSTNAAYSLNLAAFNSEANAGEVSEYGQAIAVLMMISEETQSALTGILSDAGVVLAADYSVVTCASMNSCLPEGNAARTATEPYSGTGDPDEDGLTNAEEFDEIVTVGGGTLQQFAASALGGAIGGSSGGGGSCVIAVAAFGTPLADELTAVRRMRDSYLLNNPLGTAFSDAYYRMSSSLTQSAGQSGTFKSAVHSMVSFALLLVNQAWIYLSAAVMFGALIRRSRKT
jgi:YVTN family beta-propeller protein